MKICLVFVFSSTSNLLMYRRIHQLVHPKPMDYLRVLYRNLNEVWLIGTLCKTKIKKQNKVL